MSSATLLPLPTGRRRHLHGSDDLLDALGIPFSPAQLEAITAPLEPGVIIAGAGSGKTTVMAARVVWLVGTGAVRPEQVLGLTFTRKAAAELSARVRAALTRAGVISADGVDEAGEQVVMTYDAFAAALVAEHGLRLGVDVDPGLISGATRFRLASRVVSEAAGPFEQLSRLRPATVTERVLRLDSEMQSHLVTFEQLHAQARAFRLALAAAPSNNRGNPYADIKRAALAVEERLELASLVADYARLKRELGVVEFPDQMAVAARLASEMPVVSAALRGHYRVVLLDEYQDTSAAQARLLRGLFSGDDADGGLGHPVTAVGDPFQAIYGWRGAAASNILSFGTDFRRPDRSPARTFTLRVNRRSGQTVLDVANVLSTPLRAEPTLAAVGDADRRLVAPPSSGPGRVRAAVFLSWAEEVQWVCDAVVGLRSAGEVGAWSDVAILTRRNADIGPLYAALSERDVPVEIVGLGGLLGLPEVRDVVSTLRLVDDVTANADLVRLLTGPRWRIGLRDLALLGRRAGELSRAESAGSADRGDDADRRPPLLRSLEDAVADVDPTEVVCLLDAVENPGEVRFSAAARDRFAELAAEFAMLRRHSDEPLLDVARRVVTTLGLDTELMASAEFAPVARRDQLGAFLDAVADYVDVDGTASLSGLLAYLQAESEQGTGLEQAVPSDADAVKLLTVHKAKGLEWGAVFLPALMTGTFPTDRVTDNWVTNAAVLPAELRGDADAIPQLAEASNPALADYKRALTEQQRRAEDRLAYVAVTRAKQLLVGSGHYWRADLIKPRTPSPYLQAVLAEADRQGCLDPVAPPPPDGAANPLSVEAAAYAWPQPLDPEAEDRRRQAAALVNRARVRFAETGRFDHDAAGAAEPLLLDDAEVLAGWDADLDQLLAESARSGHRLREVALPATLSASALLRLGVDADGYAADLARPMPRRPSRRAQFGTRFHRWVERYFSVQSLLDPDDLPDRADADADGEEDFRELTERFAAGRFAVRTPTAVEAPFSLLLGDRVVRGRIDAVFADTADGRPLVVDWKTSSRQRADPAQLAVYRLAWAELTGVPAERVAAAFYFVRTDELVHPELPDQTALLALLRNLPTRGGPRKQSLR